MGLIKQLKRAILPVRSAEAAPADIHAGPAGSLEQEPAQTIKTGKQRKDLTDKKTRVQSLTQREQETFALLLDGYTLKEAAQQMGVKYSTANTHMTELYRKLGINSRAELIIYYREFNNASE
ncbi:MAG: LuxR C-terminal-related transcriptional regulator [Clostridiaceae bacterium]|nr:LuxR C-terminal-related transcriptional regulator [Clostridiaceae bacterium]